jgi:hypothetical protein
MYGAWRFPLNKNDKRLKLTPQTYRLHLAHSFLLGIADLWFPSNLGGKTPLWQVSWLCGSLLACAFPDLHPVVFCRLARHLQLRGQPLIFTAFPFDPG